MRMGRIISLCLTSSTLHGLFRAIPAACFFAPRLFFARGGVGGSFSRNTESAIMATSSDNNNIGLGDVGKATRNEIMTSWRDRIDVSVAKSRKIRGGNYVQIATVDAETNEPRCRTVVFRGFQDVPTGSVDCSNKPCVMKMITDNRSNKVSEASKNSACEMVWWFGKSSEQYRIRGSLKFVGGDTEENGEKLAIARKQQWGNLSDPAREQFYWKEPGIAYSGESTVPQGGRDENGKVLPPPDTFLLMLLFPTRVEYLRLGDNFRQIDEVKDGKWTMERVNP